MTFCIPDPGSPLSKAFNVVKLAKPRRIPKEESSYHPCTSITESTESVTLIEDLHRSENTHSSTTWTLNFNTYHPTTISVYTNTYTPYRSCQPTTSTLQ